LALPTEHGSNITLESKAKHEDKPNDDAARTSVIGWLMSFVICAFFFASSRFVGNFIRAASQVTLKRLNSP
jgi:hypothetical protein